MVTYNRGGPKRYFRYLPKIQPCCLRCCFWQAVVGCRTQLVAYCALLYIGRTFVRLICDGSVGLNQLSFAKTFDYSELSGTLSSYSLSFVLRRSINYTVPPYIKWNGVSPQMHDTWFECGSDLKNYPASFSIIVWRLALAYSVKYSPIINCILL